ncbi:hypothetical protein HRbin15_02663 [bacterium HR15]|nr:hypothetical protein HRbin15_02663 [bacterium HR15]
MMSNLVLLDTGVVLRYITGDVDVLQRIRELRNQFGALLICPQVLYEFWVVATRFQAQGGFGLKPDQAGQFVNQIVDVFTLLPDPEDLWVYWVQLCVRHGVSGRQAHDARLVAWMDAYRISHLYTLNASDFRRYTHIQTV